MYVPDVPEGVEAFLEVDPVMDFDGSPVTFYRWMLSKDGAAFEQIAQTSTPRIPAPTLATDGAYRFAVVTVDAAGRAQAQGPALGLLLDNIPPPMAGVPRMQFSYKWVDPPKDV